MKGFYQHFFPHKFLWDWLSNHNQYPLENREFRFGENFNIIQNGFLTEHEFCDYLTTNQPKGVYLGYYKKPNTFRNPRPVFFDVDLDDYILPKGKINRELLCPCKEKQCCDICWEMIMRKPLLDCLHFLKEFMGFQHVFAVFSGGRGFWIYLCDDWEMDRECREILADRIPAMIDKQVTIQMNHLMKVPLSTHRSTGVVCSPIMNPEEFIPSRDTRHFSKLDEGIVREWVSFITTQTEER